MSDLPPLPEGDRFTDTSKFRRLGEGGGSVLYECWSDAIEAYARAAVAAEQERCAKLCDERRLLLRSYDYLGEASVCGSLAAAIRREPT